MAQAINVLDPQELKGLLLRLKPDDVPLWGKMTPQQMVEHLVDQVEYTNGKYTGVCNRPADEAEADKQRNVYSPAKIPRNVILGPLPEHNRFPDLQTAIETLIMELNRFEVYFATPGVTAVHDFFGAMTYHEWQLWHTKHFSHHIEQFGLIADGE